MNMQHARIIAVLAAFVSAGCLSERRSIVPLVDDIGGEVRTKYRYRLSWACYSAMTEDVAFDGSILAQEQPQVFSANGIPFVLRLNGFGNYTHSGSWTGVLSMFTFGLVPFVSQGTREDNCSVELADDASIRAPFVMRNMNDNASGPYPTAFLFFNDAAEVEGHRVFCEATRHSTDKNPTMVDLFSVAPVIDFDRRMSGGGYRVKGFEIKATDLGRQALAYAIAVKLKELEDSGKIDAMLRKRAENRSVAPPHSIVRLERDSDNAFSYSFAVQLERKPPDMKAAAKLVLREFTASLKDEYLDAHRNADAASLVVSFSSLKVEGLCIEGRAAVLAIKPVSLSYDNYTQRGKLTVRFEAGQSKEAREWIRKNIETLARDKNIALVTGQPPPAATYYLLGEKLDGNLMTIEFKTE